MTVGGGPCVAWTHCRSALRQVNGTSAQSAAGDCGPRCCPNPHLEKVSDCAFSLSLLLHLMLGLARQHRLLSTPSRLLSLSHLALLCLHRPAQHHAARFLMTTPSHLSPAPGWDISKKPFPPAQRGDQVDTYKSAAQGEVKIADPYRWLETPPNQSPETKKWVESQADFAQSYIQQFDGRDELKKRLEASFSYARYSCPSLKYDGRFYYNFNSGLESQSRIFKADPKQIDEVEKRGSAADAGPPGEVFFDANKLSKDGTVALT